MSLHSTDMSLRIVEKTTRSNPSRQIEKVGSLKLHESNDHKHNILKAFWGLGSKKITQAKRFLDEIEKCSAKNDKVEMTSLLTSLMFVKYKGQENVR
ncbi:hypothetical protein J1N35_006109 [Gossypium stocksii]|uniref:Uncharacterized protein n=1 Tax=Gossypium stocksii TaxID=47602 RepID=A0A9D3WFA2_9ROSI|nr:hypothetical protein J1N35_006109 [Gossypium stocksii]